MSTDPGFEGATVAARGVGSRPLSATVEQVEMTLGSLIGRLTRLDGGRRAMLPKRRTIEAYCPDLDVMYHANWRGGKLSGLHVGPADRPDIRIELASEDLVRLADGTLDFRIAYAQRRVKIDAGLTDLLRLRAVL